MNRRSFRFAGLSVCFIASGTGCSLLSTCTPEFISTKCEHRPHCSHWMWTVSRLAGMKDDRLKQNEPKQGESKQTKRRSYHHGDLKQALLEAGVEMAREGGGPDAVALREATRRAGVAPNAAYRHYTNRHDLVQAVRSAALAGLARSIEQELAKVDETAGPMKFGRDSVRAVGTGYIQFAVSEPGLFRAAFTVPDALQGEAVPEKAGESGMNPFQLLGLALDRCMDAGLLSPEQRQGAEFIAWSAVHGLSMLVIDGPLRELPPEAIHKLGQRVIDMVEAGIAHQP